MAIQVDEHIIRNIAQQVMCIKDKAKRNKDYNYIVLLEKLSKAIDSIFTKP